MGASLTGDVIAIGRTTGSSRGLLGTRFFLPHVDVDREPVALPLPLQVDDTQEEVLADSGLARHSGDYRPSLKSTVQRGMDFPRYERIGRHHARARCEDLMRRSQVLYQRRSFARTCWSSLRNSTLRYVRRVDRGTITRLLRLGHDAPAAELPLTSEPDRGALFHAITEVSADGILVVSPEGRIVSSNMQMREMWGLTRDESEWQSSDEALTLVRDRVVDPDTFVVTVQALYRQPDERSWGEVVLKDGRTFERYTAPVVGPDRTRYGRVWFYRDVTARKEAEQLVTKLREDFAAAVVHDLRGPIMAILLQASLLLEGRSRGELSVEESALRRIERQALQLSRLTTDLLDTTTIDPRSLRLNVELLSLSAFACEIIDNFKPMLANHIVLVDFDDVLPPVYADRQRLGQVLMNLLVNAAAYSPNGSTIDVEVRAREGGVMLAVRDGGVGIPAEDLPYVFDRFFRGRQTGAMRKGHGLGLYVAHALVDAHGGRIDVASALGAGSTFRVWLPAGDPHSPCA